MALRGKEETRGLLPCWGQRATPSSADMHGLRVCEPPLTPPHRGQEFKKKKQGSGESQKPKVIDWNVLSFSPNPCLANSRGSINVCSVYKGHD